MSAQVERSSTDRAWSGQASIGQIELRRAVIGGPPAGVGQILWPWAVSRLLAIASLTLAGSLSEGRLDLTALTDWDSRWYLAIAQHGYGHGPIPAHWALGNWSRWPFFPLLPALTRFVMTTGAHPAVAIVLVNNVAFLVALAGVHRLASRHLSGDSPVWAVWALALFPGSITSVMGYSGGLFVAGTVWAFVLAEDQRFLLASAASLVAVTARPNGILVLVALLPVTIAAAGPTRASLHALAKANLLPALFVLGWFLWLRSSTGDAMVFLHAKSAWLEKSIIDFVLRPNGSSIVHVVLAAVAVAVLTRQHHRLPLSWKALAVLSLAPSLALGVVGLGRYAAECFPVSMALGVVLVRSRPWLRNLYLISSAAGLIAMGLLIHHVRLVP